MFDVTPAPYGDVTRQWTALSPRQRDRHAARLLDVPPGAVDVDGHADLTAAGYERLVRAARDGDEVAFAWLATTHRPMLLHRGRAIFEEDPAEWGALCLELLTRAVRTADLAYGPWLRRHIAKRMTEVLCRRVRHHLRRRQLERATDPVDLPSLRTTSTDPGHDPHPDLSRALAMALEGLDAVTLDALRASADGARIQDVAAQHHIDPAVLRQRLLRARHRLQPRLAGFQRTSSVSR